MPGTLLVTDDWSAYGSLRARGYDHHAIAECGDPEVAEEFLPISHLVFSNLKTWLKGIHHGVSAKHLQAYLNECSRSASIGGSTRSTPSALSSGSRATPLLRPMLSSTPVSGNTQDVAGVGLNRIGTDGRSPPSRPPCSLLKEAPSSERKAPCPTSNPSFSARPTKADCKSAPKVDPTDSNSFKDLRCRSASRPHAE